MFKSCCFKPHQKLSAILLTANQNRLLICYFFLNRGHHYFNKKIAIILFVFSPLFSFFTTVFFLIFWVRGEVCIIHRQFVISTSPFPYSQPPPSPYPTLSASVVKNLTILEDPPHVRRRIL